MTEDTIKNLIKLTRDVDDAGNLSDAGQVVAHIGTTKTFTVTVASKTSAHRYNGSGSGNGYVIDGVQAPYIELLPDVTYQFDQSDSSNSGHPLLFYLEADKTTQYSTGVTTNGTPGSAGAYTQIAVTDATPVVLYYQCSAHAFMGNAVSVENKYIINTFASNTYAASTFTSNNSLNTRLGGFVANNSLNTRFGGFVANSFFQDNQPSSFGVVSATVVNGSASGTYTVPAGINYIAGVVTGGGGGGGANVDGNSSAPGGGDGGAGGICGFGFAVTPGATYSYSIGAGGNRATYGNNFANAGSGGTSNFSGNTFRGNGGSAGGNSTTNVQTNSGALGGNGSGGAINVAGTTGTALHGGRVHKGIVHGVLGTLGGSTVDKNGTILSNASDIGNATVGQGGNGSAGGFNEDGGVGQAGSLIVYEFS